MSLTCKGQIHCSLPAMLPLGAGFFCCFSLYVFWEAAVLSEAAYGAFPFVALQFARPRALTTRLLCCITMLARYFDSRSMVQALSAEIDTSLSDNCPDVQLPQFTRQRSNCMLCVSSRHHCHICCSPEQNIAELSQH